MRWRVFKLNAFPAYMNMSIDEAISESMTKEEFIPSIRFYKWLPGAVSIGRFQSMREEVNVERCRELGIDCIRRETGGGAVYHDEEGELTYSIIAPQNVFKDGIRESYAEICGYVVIALRKLKLDAVFAPINDILVNGKKLSGSAQTRKNGILLQHGTILYRTNLKKMFSVLNVSKEKISDKMIKTVEERVTSIKNEDQDISFDNTYQAMLSSFTSGKEFYFDGLTEKEQLLLPKLKEKYKSMEWNFYR